MYEKFAKLLDERGILAAQVAKEADIDQSRLSDWKHGKSKPKAEILYKLSKYFGVPMEYFVEAEE